MPVARKRPNGSRVRIATRKPSTAKAAKARAVTRIPISPSSSARVKNALANGDSARAHSTLFAAEFMGNNNRLEGTLVENADKHAVIEVEGEPSGGHDRAL